MPPSSSSRHATPQFVEHSPMHTDTPRPAVRLFPTAPRSPRQHDPVPDGYVLVATPRRPRMATDVGPDALAGIVDLFGALTAAELEEAVEELTFRLGEDHDRAAVDDAVEEALERHVLVETDQPDERVLIVGPAAFPRLPEHAEDLPHIMSVPNREVDRDAVAATILEGLLDRAEGVDPDSASGEDEEEASAGLLELSYDLEAWASVDAGPLRDRLEGEGEGDALDADDADDD